MIEQLTIIHWLIQIWSEAGYIFFLKSSKAIDSSSRLCMFKHILGKSIFEKMEAVLVA